MREPQGRARSTGQAAIAATVALLGFLLEVQLRSTQGLTERLGLEREADLGRILTELARRNDDLEDTILEMRIRLQQRAGSQAQERALTQDARARLQTLQIMLGIVPVRGRGIEITIADPQRTVGPEVLLDAVQELRDAGAEAIEINGRRVVAQTSFTGGDGAIRMGTTSVRSPYRIRAIGAPGTLAEAMRIPGGVVDTVGTREGASVRVLQRSSVTISSVSRLPSFRHARTRR